MVQLNTKYIFVDLEFDHGYVKTQKQFFLQIFFYFWLVRALEGLRLVDSCIYDPMLQEKKCEKKLEKVKFFRKFDHDLVALIHLQHGVIYTWCESSRPPLEHAIVEWLKRVFKKNIICV